MMAPSRADASEEEAFISDENSLLKREEGGTFYQRRPRGSYLRRLLDSVAKMTIRRRHQMYSPMVPSSSPPPFKSEHSTPTRTSSRWTTVVSAILRRFFIIAPIIILMLFGVIHVLQVIIGRAQLFWDVDSHELFLPHWGEEGHYGAGLAKYPTDATRDIIPIPCHSHNDYWRRIPLFEAIHYGCTGVEADVWLFDEELYVGHNTAALTRNRTFRSLYVDPLVELLDKQNPRTDFVNASRHGVFDTDSSQSLVLLVDFKTEGVQTWPYVVSQLSALREKGYLTHFDGEKTIPGAVTVVGTGNTPFDLVVANTTYRDIFFDAPLDKLWEKPVKRPKPVEPAVEAVEDEQLDAKTDSDDVMETEGTPLPGENGVQERTGDGGQGNTGLENASPEDFNPSTSYYASVSFHQAVGTVWRGHLSARQMEIIRGQIRGAKRRGLKARFWDTPAWPISARNHVWHVLMKEGADILNVDDLRSAARLDWRKWRHEWW